MTRRQDERKRRRQDVMSEGLIELNRRLKRKVERTKGREGERICDEWKRERRI